MELLPLVKRGAQIGFATAATLGIGNGLHAQHSANADTLPPAIVAGVGDPSRSFAGHDLSVNPPLSFVKTHAEAAAAPELENMHSFTAKELNDELESRHMQLFPLREDQKPEDVIFYVKGASDEDNTSTPFSMKTHVDSLSAVKNESVPSQNVEGTEGVQYVEVSYPAGWNLVAGTPGTVFKGAGVLYALAPGSSEYTQITPDHIDTGAGYWAYFPLASKEKIAITPNDPPFVQTIPANEYFMFGNPSAKYNAKVTGAKTYGFDPIANQYVEKDTFKPGEGFIESAFDVGNGTGTITVIPIIDSPSAVSTPEAPPQQPLPKPLLDAQATGILNITQEQKDNCTQVVSEEEAEEITARTGKLPLPFEGYGGMIFVGRENPETGDRIWEAAFLTSGGNIKPIIPGQMAYDKYSYVTQGGSSTTNNPDVLKLYVNTTDSRFNNVGRDSSGKPAVVEYSFPGSDSLTQRAQSNIYPNYGSINMSDTITTIGNASTDGRRITISQAPNLPWPRPSKNDYQFAILYRKAAQGSDFSKYTKVLNMWDVFGTPNGKAYQVQSNTK